MYNLMGWGCGEGDTLHDLADQYYCTKIMYCYLYLYCFFIFSNQLTKTVQGHDGQLFDSTWRHKGKRYLCFTREVHELMSF